MRVFENAARDDIIIAPYCITHSRRTLIIIDPSSSIRVAQKLYNMLILWMVRNGELDEEESADAGEGKHFPCLPALP